EAHYNVSASMGSRVKDQDFRSVDIGLATAQLVLAAVDRGLSTCILGWFDEKKLQKLLGIKERIRLVIALGYGAKEEVLRPKKRKEIGEIADFVETSPEI
ncbi:MAG: nitroreductase family protein, partial [Clostridiales bacterium]